PFAELQTTCWIQAAAGLAGRGDADGASTICDGLAAGTWQDECRFRVGEELAAAGVLGPAIASCGRAGWFARRCVTHAAWRSRRVDLPSPAAGAAVLRSAMSEVLDQVEAGLSHHEDPGVAGEGRDVFRAALGRAAYLGTGDADPRPARGLDEAAPALRTGWATEAVRLLGPTLPEDPVETLFSAWREGRPIRGPAGALPYPERYPPLALGPHDEGLPHLPLYGGGVRLVGETEDEDARIAILHALFGRPETGPDLFLPALADPRPRVRWTAAALALLAAEDDDGALRRRLAADADPVLQWLASRDASTMPPRRP
ncbi:MAG: hypothetical protein D6798_00325, partial [Deltaproteobacteria bacterium]